METSAAILEQSKQNSIFYVYDERMLKHREYPKPQAEGSTVKVHVNPEIPDRISSIYNHLKIEGLLDQMDKLEVQGVDEVEQLIATIHSQEIIDKVKDLQILLFDNECRKKNLIKRLTLVTSLLIFVYYSQIIYQQLILLSREEIFISRNNHLHQFFILQEQYMCSSSDQRVQISLLNLKVHVYSIENFSAYIFHQIVYHLNVNVSF